MSYADGAAALAPPGPAGATVQMEREEPGPLEVDQGQITFDAEGNDRADSIYYSRVLHHPGEWSGVTIGRGYDMKLRTAPEILRHMRAAKIDESTAATLSTAAGLSGDDAGAFVRRNASIEITHEQQKLLFAIVYAEKEKYASTLLDNWSNVSWDTLSEVMRDILVDLFYRGDMTYRKWNAHGFAAIVTADDLAAMQAKLEVRELWGNVDTNRYQSRIGYIQAARMQDETTDVTPQPTDRFTVRVVARGLNIRSTPSATFPANIVGALENGQTIDVFGTAGGGAWYAVSYNNQTAYISASPEFVARVN